MTRSPGGPDNPEDIDAAFAEIIAGLRRDTGDSPGWPESTEQAAPSERARRERTDAEATERADEDGGGDLLDGDPASRSRRREEYEEYERRRAEEERAAAEEAAARRAAEEDEGHYEPPEPPPLPRPRRSTLGAFALFAAGIVLVAFPRVLGMEPSVGIPLGMLVISGGVGLLLFKLRQGPPPGSGWDDGAQI